MTEKSGAEKPGVKTSEFWLAAGSLVAAAAASLGLVPQETDLQHGFAAVATGLMALWIVGQYITGRVSLKAAERQLEAADVLDVLRDAVKGGALPGDKGRG